MKSKKNPLSKYTDEQLYAELNRREFNKDVLGHKTLNVSGFTTKDVVCIQGGAYDEEDDDEYGPYYHFYIKVDNKLFDIYYQTCVTGDYEDRTNTEPSRWPEEENNAQASLYFVPTGFAESMENCYEYHGKGDVKKYLAKYGITDFRVWKPELADEDSDIDHNYDFTVKS